MDNAMATSKNKTILQSVRKPLAKDICKQALMGHFMV